MLALLKDGTIAIQTALAQALVQWPFLHDTSLVSAVMAVFMPPPAPGAASDAAASAAVAAAADALDITLLLPWLYFNLLMTDSQLYVPVLDKVGFRKGLQETAAPTARSDCHFPGTHPPPPLPGAHTPLAQSGPSPSATCPHVPASEVTSINACHEAPHFLCSWCNSTKLSTGSTVQHARLLLC